MDLTAAAAGDLAAGFPRVAASYVANAWAPSPSRRAAPFPAGTPIGLFFTNAIHSPDGAPLVASPVSVLLTLTAPLVDGAGHSTVSGVADADAAALEAGRAGPGAAARQPDLRAADGGDAREPRLRLRLRPDGAAMTKTARALLLGPGRDRLARWPRAPAWRAGSSSTTSPVRRSARASAVSADVDEPAAVWFNPANLVYLGGVSASAGGVFLTSKSSFSPAGGGAETEHASAATSSCRRSSRTACITDRVAVGMGVYSTFGIGITWPADWEGRERRDSGLARDADLQSHRRGQGAPADLGGGRLRRRPQRRRFHERLAGPDRRRRAVGRRHVGLRLQRRRPLQDLPGPAARGAHLPEPGQARLRRRAGELQPREPGLRARAARPGRDRVDHAARHHHRRA